MMRILLAACAVFAALFLSLGLIGSTPAAAGYYRSNYDGGYYGGYHRRDWGPRYHRSRGYYHRPYYRSYHRGCGYDRGCGRSYHRSFYRSHYRGCGYDNGCGGYNGGYVNAGYRWSGYGWRGGNGWGGGCTTVYLPYGWRWYRALSC
jgi:hypothetical protein